MTAPVAHWTRPARMRSLAADLLTGLPLVVFFAVIAWRLDGCVVGVGVAVIAPVLLAGVAAARARRFDAGWLVCRANTLRGDYEDSAELLFAAPAVLGPLQTLQQQRLLARLSEALGSELAPEWPWRRIAIGWAIGMPLAITAFLLLAPARLMLAPSNEGLPAIPGVPRLIEQRLRIVPPAYTGLPARNENRLDAMAPAGSRLEWTFRFAPEPRTAAIELAGDGGIALQSHDGLWTATRLLDRSLLYRVVPAGAPVSPAPPLHRIDAIADQPPKVRIVTPERTLNPIAPGQSRWSLRFAATDDYGVAAGAQLRVTLA